MAVVAKMEIVMESDGNVHVSGTCMDNKIVAYSLLEIAKDAIRTNVERIQSGKVAIPASGDVAKFGAKMD